MRRRRLARSLLLILVTSSLVVAHACDEEAASPDAAPDDETVELIRFYTEGIPDDGMIVYRDGSRSEVFNGRAIQFAEFVTHVLADESKAVVLTHDLGTARSLGLLGGFPWNDGMLYRASAHSLPGSVLATLAIGGVLSDIAFGSADCALSDYRNAPSKWDFIQNTGRAREFVAYGKCVDDLARGIEGNKGCVIVTSPVLNPDTEVYDLHQRVVCDEAPVKAVPDDVVAWGSHPGESRPSQRAGPAIVTASPSVSPNPPPMARPKPCAERASELNQFEQPASGQAEPVTGRATASSDPRVWAVAGRGTVRGASHATKAPLGAGS